MRTFTLICILFVSTLYSAHGQSKQYAVKINGDTIRGKVMINPVRDNSRSMFFKGDDGFKGNLSPLRYQFVYYNDKVQYRSVVFLRQKLFMQIVSEGQRIKLYNYVHNRDNSIVNSRVALKPNGESVELSALTFKNQMRDFLEDCPALIAKLDTKEYRFRNHQELFEAYEHCELFYEVVTRQPVQPAATVQANATPPTETETEPIPATPETPDVNGPQKQQLDHLEDFRTYVQSLNEHQAQQDILDLLVDLENRLKQKDAIPNYLWSSLSGMIGEHQELSKKAEDLKTALQ